MPMALALVPVPLHCPHHEKHRKRARQERYVRENGRAGAQEDTPSASQEDHGQNRPATANSHLQQTLEVPPLVGGTIGGPFRLPLSLIIGGSYACDSRRAHLPGKCLSMGLVAKWHSESPGGNRRAGQVNTAESTVSAAARGLASVQRQGGLGRLSCLLVLAHGIRSFRYIPPDLAPSPKHLKADSLTSLSQIGRDLSLIRDADGIISVADRRLLHHACLTPDHLGLQCIHRLFPTGAPPCPGGPSLQYLTRP